MRQNRFSSTSCSNVSRKTAPMASQNSNIPDSVPGTTARQEYRPVTSPSLALPGSLGTLFVPLIVCLVLVSTTGCGKQPDASPKPPDVGQQEARKKPDIPLPKVKFRDVTAKAGVAF